MQDLARAARLDRGTVGDFLVRRRWPQARTQGAIEQALGWPFGALGELAEGLSPAGVGDEPAVEGSSVGAAAGDLTVRVSRLPPEQQAEVWALVERLEGSGGRDWRLPPDEGEGHT